MSNCNEVKDIAKKSENTLQISKIPLQDQQNICIFIFCVQFDNFLVTLNEFLQGQLKYLFLLIFSAALYYTAPRLQLFP